MSNDILLIIWLFSSYLTNVGQLLPFYGFCDKALPKQDTIITVVDYLGTGWKCELSFVRVGDMVYCRLGGD